MVDIFVDKIIHNAEIKKEWKERTKDLIKVNGYKKMLNDFLSVSEEVNEELYKRNSIPKRFFKGNLKITDIADDFGLKPLRRKLRICPFHEDKNPSLSLDNNKGIFNCFGCGVKGNIITFYAMLKRGRRNGTIN